MHTFVQLTFEGGGVLVEAMNVPALESKNVVITGCSTGIGAATARLLKDRGWNVAATARKPDDVSNLHAQGFHAIGMDIADESSVTGAVRSVLDIFDGRIGAVVNNAGFGQSGAVEDLTRDVLRYQFEVNLIGMQDFTNRFIPVMRRQGWGRIINISSVLGRISLPFMGSYAATKFAMEALSDALRVELHGSGIAVSLIEPGPISSAFRQNAADRARATLNFDSGAHADFYKFEVKRRESQNARPDIFTLPPEAVAKKIIKALDTNRPKARYRVTLPAYGGEIIRRLAPHSLIDKVMTRRAVKKK